MQEKQVSKSNNNQNSLQCVCVCVCVIEAKLQTSPLGTEGRLLAEICIILIF